MSREAWWGSLEPVATPEGVLRVAAPAELVGLRRAVLRDGRPDLEAAYPFDDEPGTLHLAVVADAGVVGCVTVRVDPLPGAATLHLVLMAVDTDHRGRGVGRALVDTVQGAARAGDLDVWAASRSTAVDFYRTLGFRPLGDVYTGPMELPHRRVLWRSRLR
jgi:ribosomal protein S18 acetylase RimI-like enzyme